MQIYNNILIALELAGGEDYLIEAAVKVASREATFRFIHAFEAPIYPADSYLANIPLQAREDEIARAESIFAELREKFSLSAADSKVVVGRPAREIHRAAIETKADLIVVGSHGRHGLQLLLGSTSNAVLHGAGCDVLAVRLPS